MGHTVQAYPAEDLTRPCSGVENGDLTVLALPPLLLSGAYQSAGLEFNPDVPHIGYWCWETDKVPLEWKRACAEFHIRELWAPSKFVRDAMLNRDLGVPVYEIRPPFNWPNPLLNKRPKKYFAFLFVFDCSSIWERKNLDGLLEAYRRTFTKTDRVILQVKTVRALTAPTELHRVLHQALKFPAPVEFIEGSLSSNDLWKLFNAADCYVSPHRAEGLGLTIIDAAMLSTPVIATRYSLGYLPPDYPLAIHSRIVPTGSNRIRSSVAAGMSVYAGNGRWAEPDVADLAAKMRWVYENRKQANTIAGRLQRHVRKFFSWKKVEKSLRIRLASNCEAA
jgi:glycosyltransferase involved in cell wall biosynthesis